MTATPTRYLPAYCLELRLGGAEPLCFATSELHLTSREDGGERVYAAGLSEVVFAFGGDALSVSVRYPDLPALRAQVGPLVGRPFVLRLHRGEAAVEGAAVVLQGLVSAASWCDLGAPEVLSLTLRRADLELTSDAVDPQAVVDESSIPDEFYSVATAADPQIVGAAFPLVFGAPGRQFNDSDTGSARAATPALQVETAGALGTVLVAGHEVAATEVYLWDLSESAPSASVYSVQTTEDALGRKVSTCRLTGDLVSGVGLAPTVGSKLFAGWSPRPGKGCGAMLDDGEPVRGLGDLLLWGARNRSAGVFDLGRLHSERQRLNRFQIDAVINQRGLRWGEWLARSILDPFGVDLVSGAEGFYYREQVYLPDPARVRAQLTTDGAGLGLQVQRASAVEDESVDQVVNEITVAFSPYAMSTTAFSRRVTVGPTRSKYHFGPTDGLLTAHRACRRSAEMYGQVSRTILCAVTCDTVTAWELARRQAERYALPAQVVRYSGGLELLDLAQAYDTVELTDEAAGFSDTLAVVQPGVVVSEREVTVTLRIPDAAWWLG
jgi:hypothetical protein